MVGMDIHEHSTEGGRPRSIVGRLGLSLFLLVFLAMGTFFELFIVREFVRALGQRVWSKAPCTIVSSEVQERDDRSTPFAFAVRYEFHYGGQLHTGSAYKRRNTTFSTYSEAQQLAQKYPVGSATFCYVNPENPGEVVLRRDSLALGLGVLFPWLFIAIGAGGIYFTWRRRPLDIRQPIATTAICRDARGEGKGKYALAAFLALVALAGGGMLYPLGIKPITRAVAAQSWVATPCRVLRAEVRSHDGDDGTTYSVYIFYEYEFRGQPYKCDRYSFVGGSSSGYQAKTRIVEQYRSAAHPICYVNPHDPTQAVLQRGFHAGFLVALVPLVFLLVGVGGLVGVLRGNIAVTVGTATTKAGTARHATPGAKTLSFPGVTGRDQTLLTPRFSAKTKFIGMIVVALFWNGIISIIIPGLIGGLAHGHPNWFGLLFLSPFAAIGIVLIGGAVYQFLAIFNPRPALELNPGTIPLGGTAELRWSFRGRTGRIDELTVTVRGVEEAKYSQGTSTCTDRNTFYEMELYRTAFPNEIVSGCVGFVLPQDTMHSFEAKNNKILWSLNLHGRIRRWPDVKESFQITVTPAVD